MDDGLQSWIIFTIGIVLAGLGVFAMILSPLLALVGAGVVVGALWVTGTLSDDRERE